MRDLRSTIMQVRHTISFVNYNYLFFFEFANIYSHIRYLFFQPGLIIRVFEVHKLQRLIVLTKENVFKHPLSQSS